MREFEKDVTVDVKYLPFVALQFGVLCHKGSHH